MTGPGHLPDPPRRPAGPAIAAALLLLAACGLAFFLHLGTPGLMEQDEPRYAEPARVMARGGEWLVPSFNGRERLVKPPGTYWAIATSFLVTGREDETSARLPSAVAATLTVLLVALGAGRALGTRWGVLAGLALATMLQFVIQARIATTDMLFTLFFTGTAAALVPQLEGRPRPGPWMALAGALAGIAALVKTPLGLVLPPLAVVVALVVLKRRAPPLDPEGGPSPWSRPRFGPVLLGLAVATVVFGTWIHFADQATDGRFREALRSEVESLQDADAGVHVKPFWYFALLLPASAFPWSLLLPAGVVAAASSSRRSPPEAATTTFSLVLAAAVFLYFSFQSRKLPSYLLPALPPLAVVIAAGAKALAEDPAGAAGRLGRAVGGWGALAVAAAVAAAPALPSLREVVDEDVRRAAVPVVAAVAGLVAAGGLLLLLGRPRDGLLAFAAAPLTVVLLAVPLLPAVESEKSARDLVAAMRSAGLAPGDRIYDTGNSLKGVPWYADRTTETRPDGSSPPEAAAVAALSGRERAWVISEHDPADARARGKRTQWERILQDLSPGAPVPRVVYRGMRRIVVTNVPVR